MTLGQNIRCSAALAALCAVLSAAPLIAASQEAAVSFEYPFQNPDLADEERISDLIARMTLEEKISCMAWKASVPRLGVKGSPHIEGYHGVAQGGPSNWGHYNPTATTQFPQAYGLGSTWDPDLIQRVAAQEAQEARYLFQSAKYDRSGLIVRAPNADLARDPRWGRTEEVYGEDPFHAGTLAAAFTRGLQGDHPRYWKTAALLKHFLANSNEDGRSSSSSNFDDRLWREYYAKTFEMAVREGGSNAMMAAYNAINGTPAHVHPMLRNIVMGEWGLDGIICTDGGGLSLLVSAHKAFDDRATAAAACIKAGINHFLDRHKEAARGVRSRRGAAGDLQGLSSPRPARPAGARPLRHDRRRGRSGAVEPAGDPRPGAGGHPEVDRAAQELLRPVAPRPRHD
jgi:beta-glucosidase